MIADYITILNKLNRKDSITGLDIWYKKKLDNIPYSIDRVTDVNGTIVSMGQAYNILIPFQDNYLPYRLWKDNDRDNYFTLSPGDLIVINRDIIEEITPNNIAKIKNQYIPDICEIRTITEVQKRVGVNIQFKIGGV